MRIAAIIFLKKMRVIPIMLLMLHSNHRTRASYLDIFRLGLDVQRRVHRFVPSFAYLDASSVPTRAYGD